MDEFLDRLWQWIERGLETSASVMDMAVAPLEAFGPAVVILILALVTVGFSKVLVKIFRTRRHDDLKKEFEHWQSVREEAMKARDKEKGKAMAKNIDQAKLNKVYYDYFFEGLMKNLVTTVLPILTTLAYLSRTYTKESLEAQFGSPWIFILGKEDPLMVGTLFWYIICIFASVAGISLIRYYLKKGKAH